MLYELCKNRFKSLLFFTSVVTMLSLPYNPLKESETVYFSFFIIISPIFIIRIGLSIYFDLFYIKDKFVDSLTNVFVK